MNTMLKLTTLGVLLACAGVAGAGNVALAPSPQYPPGPVRINPQPLPPLPLIPPFAAEGRRDETLPAPILVAPNSNPWFGLVRCAA